MTINQPTVALAIGTTPELTHPTCHDHDNGRINITVNGGTAPYYFVWSNGMATQNISGVPAGTYSVTITDANGCTVTSDDYVLTNPTAVTLTVDNITNTECNGAHGSVTLTSSNGDQIRLGSIIQDSPATFSGLQAGYYTAYTEGECPAEVSFSIYNNNSNLYAIVTTTDVVCNGDNDGKATITVSGGETPYTMSVNGGASISIIGDTHTLSDLNQLIIM